MTTIHDIARITGVNAATVSRALSGKPGVKADTKEAILKVAQELNYVPNYMAKQLKTKKSYNVAVLINISKGQALNNYFFNNILNAFFVVMEDNGYDVTFVTKEITKDRDILSFCQSRMFDGIFAVNADFTLPGMESLANSQLPMVVAESVNPVPSHYPIVSITSDNRQAMYKLVSHVIECGHSKLAYITGDDSFVTNERLAGYRQALDEHNIPFDQDMIVPSHYSVLNSVASAVDRLLSNAQLPTAIFTPDDYSSLPVFEAVRSRGMSVPADISIIGFDGIELGQNMNPPLTTISQDSVAIGNLAGRALVQLMSKETAKQPHSIIMPTALIAGGTVKQA